MFSKSFEANGLYFALSSGKIDKVCDSECFTRDKESNEITIENVRSFSKDDFELVLFINIDSQTHSSMVVSIPADKFMEIKIVDSSANNETSKSTCGKIGTLLMSFSSMIALSAILLLKKKH